MSNPFTDLPVPPECRETIRAGALVAINRTQAARTAKQ